MFTPTGEIRVNSLTLHLYDTEFNIWFVSVLSGDRRGILNLKGHCSEKHCLFLFLFIISVLNFSDKEKYLDTMKAYMPPAHAQFIEALHRGPSLRSFGN